MLQPPLPDPADRLASLDPVDLAALLRADQRARWGRGERVPAEEYLRRFPALAGTAAVRELARNEWLLREAAGERPDRGEFQARFPTVAAGLAECAELEREFAGRVLEVVAGPPAPSSFVPWTAAIDFPTPPVPDTLTAVTPAPPGRPERYTVLRLLGQGGLGQVFVARDGDLNREVALKRLRPERADRAADRQRFAREAQVTGQLEHPNIVPVYESGRDPTDGQPFYTMRLAPGRTLGEAVRDYHERRRVGREDPLDRPRLLAAFVGVCQAVAFAHSRGVLHRDLKPANVVLGNFGEVMVLDWGLAKVADKADEPASVALSGHAGAATTVEGAVVGTPAYMAPEQATGGAPDERTDVYGLGAILYEILTDRPPQIGRTAGEVLAAVTTRDPDRPRDIEPSLPRALDAICAKALARDPAARYQRAADLADDVQRFLADEPVTAWREPFAVRARRWVGRHRTLVASLAVAGSVTAVGLTIATALLTAANDRERAARTVAQAREADALRESERAAAHFRLARRAVDQYLDRVTESAELKAHGLEQLRKSLLQTAVEFLRELARQEGDDPSVRADRSRALWRLGSLALEIGTPGEAVGLSREARDTQDRLATEFPGEPAHREDRARSDNQLGNAHAHAGEFGPAEAAYERALADRRALAEASPDRHDLWAAVAATHQNLANLYRQTGRWDRAESAYADAARILERLTATNAAPEHRRVLGTVLNNQAAFLTATARPDDAERVHRRAIGLWAELATSGAPDDRRGLANAHLNLGVTLAAAERPGDAEAAYRTAVERLERLTADHPAVGEHRHALASALDNLALLLARTNRDEAEGLFRKALDHRERLVKEFAGVAEYRRGLAVTLTNLGTNLAARDKRDEARAAFRRSLGLFEALVRENPSAPGDKTDLADCHNNFAMSGLLPTAEAVEHARTALQLSEEQARAFPGVPDHAAGEARSRDNLAALHLEQGKPDLAAEEQRRAGEIQGRLVRDYPAVVAYRHDLGGHHLNRGLLAADARRWDEAAGQFARAAEVWDRLIAERPAATRFRARAGLAHYHLGIVRMESVGIPAAEASFRAAVGHWEHLTRSPGGAESIAADLGQAYYFLGWITALRVKPTDALAWYDRSISTLEPLRARDRENALVRRRLMMGYVGRATALDMARPGASLPDWVRAIELADGASRVRAVDGLRRAVQDLMEHGVRILCGEVGRALPW